MYYIVLCYIVLYYIVLCYIVLYYIVQYMCTCFLPCLQFHSVMFFLLPCSFDMLMLLRAAFYIIVCAFYVYACWLHTHSLSLYTNFTSHVFPIRTCTCVYVYCDATWRAATWWDIHTGMCEGSFNLGTMYMQGEGVSRDLQKARACFLLGTEQNSKNEACFVVLKEVEAMIIQERGAEEQPRSWWQESC